MSLCWCGKVIVFSSNLTDPRGKTWCWAGHVNPRPSSTRTALPSPASSPKRLSREGTK